MDFNTTIELGKVSNSTEREILKALDRKGKCLFGDIMKELEMSPNTGQKVITNMLANGLIKYHDKSFYLMLNVKLV